jgi:hypothetical protein
MRKILFMMAAIVVAAQVLAKLPAPTEEAKTKAVETKAKAVWSDKVAAYQLCKSQDKIAAQYLKAKSQDAKPAMATVPCQEPGPYVSPAMVSGVTSVTATSASLPVATVTPKK